MLLQTCPGLNIISPFSRTDSSHTLSLSLSGKPVVAYTGDNTLFFFHWSDGQDEGNTMKRTVHSKFASVIRSLGLLNLKEGQTCNSCVAIINERRLVDTRHETGHGTMA